MNTQLDLLETVIATANFEEHQVLACCRQRLC
jgi:hypothetical protein